LSSVPKRIAILGSTGSIGESTLDVVRTLEGLVEVVGLAVNRNLEGLRRQIKEYAPRAVAVRDAETADVLSRMDLPPGTRLLAGAEGLVELAAMPEADLVVSALVGASGIEPTLAAIRAGKDIAIANKECLVAAGNLLISEARSHGVSIVPIDSEHSAVFQCLKGEENRAVRRLVLTASGGPLIDRSAAEMEEVTSDQALRHPTWKMGRKVTIDSATLLNKGFEVIEASWLFGIEAGSIDVMVERSSTVHALVEFTDGVVMALLSAPDMRIPIQYALTYPDRMERDAPRLNLFELGPIELERPDSERFPCLALAYEALRRGGTAGAVLSAADEIAVQAFLDGEIGFGGIQRMLRTVLDEHEPKPASSLEAVLEADLWARDRAREVVLEMGKEA
jgi:1-deoxy-D-xylulose-5-phosphate reductoisomerase